MKRIRSTIQSGHPRKPRNWAAVASAVALFSAVVAVAFDGFILLRVASLSGIMLALILFDVFLVACCCVLVPFILMGVRLGCTHQSHEHARRDREAGDLRFRAFMDDYPTVAFLKDSSGRILYVNQAYCQANRYDPERLVGKSDVDLMPLNVAEKLLANDQVVRETRRGQQFEESVIDSAGVLRHWLTFKFPVTGQDGELFLGAMAVEVTDKVKALEALRESELRYRQIVEYAGDIIVRCDASGRITYINEMGARLMQLPASRVLRRRALSLVVPSARRRARAIMWRAVVNGTSDLYMEVPFTAGDGSELWLGQTIRILRTGDTVHGFQGICRDITGRRRMEIKLRANEERFRVLYENGPVAYHEIDREGTIQRVNHAECELLGYAEAELVGRSVLELMAPEERETARAAIRAKIDLRSPLQPFTRHYVRPDGRRVRVEIHENLLRDNQENIIGIHSVLLDVTQQHLAEKLDHDRRDLSEMIAQQQPLARILNGIAGMISHQDETLLCIPVQLDEQQLTPISSNGKAHHLSHAISQLGKESLSSWTGGGFQVSHHKLAELSDSAAFGGFADAAIRLGMQACWSIPIVTSTKQRLGLLIVFSPRPEIANDQERGLLEAASRTAAIAIEHRYLSDLLAFQAGHDSLTRLPNRSSFETRLQESIIQAAQHVEQLALFYIDLDRFKEVNDTFGHGGGDALLRQVATRLRRCVRHTDMLARIGGDEFSVLLTGLRDPAEASRLAETMLRAFSAPFDISGWPVNVTASIGVSFYPRDGQDAPTLQRNSDTAMYRVKNTGKNNFRCFGGNTEVIAGKSEWVA